MTLTPAVYKNTHMANKFALVCVAMFLSLFLLLTFALPVQAAKKAIPAKAAADPLDSWTQVNGPTADTLNGVAFGNGTFVAAGTGGNIFTSSNGTTWTQAAFAGNINAVTFDSGKFVAAGYNYDGATDTFAAAIFTSPDGTTWTSNLITTTAAGQLNAVAFGNGTFVAAGTTGLIFTSPDGTTWTQVTPAVADEVLNGVTFANGTFVAVGYDIVTSAPIFLTSPDGTTWTLRTSPVAAGQLNAVAFGNGTFVAAGTSGLIFTSPDGTTWTQATPAVTPGNLKAVAFSSGIFVVVGYTYDGLTDTFAPVIFTSPDGTTWTLRALPVIDPAAAQLNAVAFGNGTFVAAGTSGLILQSGSVGPVLTVTKAGDGSGTVTSAPPGIDCGATCSASFTTGTAVTLTAAAASGSNFTGWSGGGCSGTGTCTVTMNAATAVTATFSTVTYQLTVTKAGAGSGTVTSAPPGIDCGATCSASFGPGTAVTLTAAAASGSNFTGWSGGGCSGTGTCTVTMNAATAVTATFALNNPCTYTLTPASKTNFPANGGSVNVTVKATGATECVAPTITPSDSWITAAFTAAGWKNNRGTVKVTVAKSTTSSERSGSVAIENATFGITQKAVVCTITKISPPSRTVLAAGQDGLDFSFTLSAADCAWTVASNVDWITAAANGTPSEVEYNVAQNSSGKRRVGKITVTLTQNGKKGIHTVIQGR